MNFKVTLFGWVVLFSPFLAAEESVPTIPTPYYSNVSTTSQPGNNVDYVLAEVPQGLGFNWVVSIGKKGRNHALGGHFCGGSVLNDRWILTAAHCLYRPGIIVKSKKISPTKIQVRVGYDLATGGVHYDVEKIVIHDDYEQTVFKTLRNDVALLKTKEKIIVNSVITVIRKGTENYIIEDVTVLGWGKPARYLNYINERLRFLYLQKLDNETCNTEFYRGLIDDNMICAIAEGADACHGDSGGPLVAFDANLEPFLYGIVSWGEQCGETGKPAIFASVPYHYPWIEKTMNSD